MNGTGIFIYIYHNSSQMLACLEFIWLEFMVGVGKISSPMEHMRDRRLALLVSTVISLQNLPKGPTEQFNRPNKRKIPPAVLRNMELYGCH